MQIKHLPVIIIPKKAGNSDIIKGFEFSKDWNGSKHFLKITFRLQYVTPTDNQWLHTYSWRKNQALHRLKNCLGLAWAILRAWSHTELKRAGRKNLPCWGLIIHHPELQLEHSVIMVPPYGSDLWEHSHSTVHLAGHRSWPFPWRDPAAVGNGLCPTCPCWARAAGSHLVLPCDKPAILPAYCLHNTTAISKLQLAL